MNILFFTVDFSVRTSGGIGTYLHNVGNALARAGHEVCVASPVIVPRPGAAYRLHHVDGCDPHPDRRPRLAEHFLREARRLDGQAPVDVIEATDWGLEGLACVRSAGFPVVVRLHTPDSLVCELNGSRRYLDSAAVHAAEPEYFAGAACLSSPSHAMARLVGSRWPVDASKVRVIPNPLVISPPPEPANAAPPGAGFRVAFFGRLERRKGAYVLAEALRELLPARPELSVDWIGPDTRLDGGSVGRDLRTSLAPWSDRIRFLGFLEGAETFAALRRSDAVVMPSLWENAPYACLEAVACGKPVVATTGSGFDEILTHGVNGLLVPPSDPAALAEAIGRLASGALPRAVALDPEKTDRLRPATIIPQLEQLYRQVRDSWSRASAS